MDGLTRVDELYDAFLATLAPPLDAAARGLTHTLGLASSREVPWSQVLRHEITLAAPSLAAEAMPPVGEAARRDAATAHLLAVIEALAARRIAAGLVRPTPELAALIERIRAARDEALARVDADSARSFRAAEQALAEALAEERSIYASGERIDLARYAAVSRRKQQAGLPASLALARAAGWDARRQAALARALEAAALGIQVHDDVVGWGDDLARGGAWAVALAAASMPAAPPRERRTVPMSVKRLVQGSGILARMLDLSARQLRAARRRAAALGMARLAAWASGREAHVRDLARREPGPSPT